MASEATASATANMGGTGGEHLGDGPDRLAGVLAVGAPAKHIVDQLDRGRGQAEHHNRDAHLVRAP
jgi:hypothetical protein